MRGRFWCKGVTHPSFLWISDATNVCYHAERDVRRQVWTWSRRRGRGAGGEGQEARAGTQSTFFLSSEFKLGRGKVLASLFILCVLSALSKPGAFHPCMQQLCACTQIELVDWNHISTALQRALHFIPCTQGSALEGDILLPSCEGGAGWVH